MPFRDHHTHCERHTVACKKQLKGEEGTTATLRESPNPEDWDGDAREEPAPSKPGNCNNNSAKKGLLPHITGLAAR